MSLLYRKTSPAIFDGVIVWRLFLVIISFFILLLIKNYKKILLIMSFINILCLTQFFLVFLLFIFSLRNNVMSSIKLPQRFICVIISLVPIWGILLFVGGIAVIYINVKNAKQSNKKILRNNPFNRFFFGKNICF